MTQTEILDIVEETVTETAKDLGTISEMIRLIAGVSMELGELLAQDPEVSPELSMQTRTLSRQHALAWQCAVKLKERQKTPCKKPENPLHSSILH